MCGRFNVIDSPDVKALMYSLGLPDLYPRPQLNVPPGGVADFVAEAGGSRQLLSGIWSLLIEKKPDGSGYRPNPKFKTFNAKSTRLTESKLWKRAYPSSRCVVPVSAFHEWQGKQVYNIHPEGEATALAGLWQSWHFGDDLVNSFTVITLPPHERFNHIHSKSIPLMLRPHDFDMWLDADFHDTNAFLGLMKSHIAAPLVCEPIKSPNDLTVVGEVEVLEAD
ncbi:SOS response-associated peptidase [Marinobacter sp. BGYM27]|nr:SOS response-associated peptidase [Marinobacter sp. BGYM27]MDG5498923.1 SOS response-associated peptidase [Marinobacter sp. BGYM27]